MRCFYIPWLGLILLLGSCVSKTGNGGNPQPQLQYKPLLMARPQLESAVSSQPPQTLQVPGKIFVGNRYLYINEQYRGIHVFDNADPSRPVSVAFLRIPGNLDMAVRGTLLYADSGPDLVTLDIGDPTQARVVGRTRNALPEVQAPVRNVVVYPGYEPASRPANTVIVGWEKVK